MMALARVRLTAPHRRARSLQSVEYSGMPLISGVERGQVFRCIKRHLGNVHALIRSCDCHWGRDQHPRREDTDRDDERGCDERQLTMSPLLLMWAFLRSA